MAEPLGWIPLRQLLLGLARTPALLLPLTAALALLLSTHRPDLAGASLSQCEASAVYVSGDQRATAEGLLQLGVPLAFAAGASFFLTTWENATMTCTWLQLNHLDAPVLLMTYPWQLPLAAEPPRSALQRNRLALRETNGILIYQWQGRL